MNPPSPGGECATLVIGGAGYIGSYLVPMLTSSGRRVTVLGRRPSPMYRLPDGVSYVAGDFGSGDLIRRLLDSHEEVVHLAYATVPNTSFENPLGDLLQNLPPTVQLFSQIADRGGKLILVSSGGTVYGEGVSLPICESHQTMPISPYGVTKLTLENYARLYAVTHGLRYVCVRPSNAYGVGQRPFVGQGFVSTAMASAMRGIPVAIFGESGSIRDYLHVRDLAAGIFSSLALGRLSETYNLGSGVGLSNQDVIDIMSSVLAEIGCKIVVANLPQRLFDVHANILDSRKLHAHTGWSPAVDFLEGLRELRGWLESCGG
mgnify:CR=1 FL=1